MDYRHQHSAGPYETLPTVAKPGRKLKLEQRLRFLRAAQLVPYMGHGTRHSLQVKGRLIAGHGRKSEWFKRSAKLRNFFITIRNMRSKKLPGALIEARYRGETHRVYTDSEGYFLLNFWLPHDPLEPGWHDVRLKVLDSIGGRGATATARSFVPPADAGFAVISDLDDTVINSSAFNKITQIRLTLFKDAAGRTAVDDVAPLYKRLVAGPTGESNNPIFYLSRSGWNLNGLLEEFLALNELPPGPMFLRDLAWREAKSIALGSNNHKIDYIRALLQTYAHLPFVLMGDSGQHDPETYWQIAMENPGRIKAIYLHDLERKSRVHAVEAIARDLRKRDVPVVHSASLTQYHTHMEKLGLIKPRGALATAGRR